MEAILFDHFQDIHQDFQDVYVYYCQYVNSIVDLKIN